MAIESARSRGDILDGKLFRFIYRLGPPQSPPVQISVVVGKRHGHAVIRNLLKRRVREACRLCLGSQADEMSRRSLSLSLVIMYRGSKQRAAGRISFDDIKRDVVTFVNAFSNLCASKLDGPSSHSNGSGIPALRVTPPSS